MRPGYCYWESERDRRRACVFLDDLDFHALRALRRERDCSWSRLSGGQIRENRAGNLHESVGDVTAQTNLEISERIVVSNEALNIVEGDRLDTCDCPERGVPVACACEHVGLQALFTELLLIVRPEILCQSSQLSVLESLEIVGPVARLRELVENDVQELMPVVLVDAGGESRELLVDAPCKASRHWIQQLAYFTHGQGL